MKFLEPIKMHDYPAEQIAFAREGNIWSIDSGADIIIMNKDTIVNSLPLPGTYGFLTVLTAKQFFKGMYSGNIKSSTPNVSSPDLQAVEKGKERISLDGYVYQTIQWNAGGNFFVAGLKPFISRDNRQINHAKLDYPVVKFQAFLRTTTLLQSSVLPCDAMDISEQYIVVLQETLHVYDHQCILLAKVPLPASLQTDRAFIFDNEQKLLVVDGLGKIHVFHLPGLEPALTYQLPLYETKQPLAITNDGLVATGNNKGKVLFLEINDSNIYEQAVYQFDGMVTSLAFHGELDLIGVGVNGQTQQGTYWLNWE
ncbi:hypothetical protein BH10BAC3_BH10BAC3_42860 [soil metagenome]